MAYSKPIPQQFTANDARPPAGGPATPRITGMVALREHLGLTPPFTVPRDSAGRGTRYHPVEAVVNVTHAGRSSLPFDVMPSGAAGGRAAVEVISIALAGRESVHRPTRRLSTC